MTNAKHARAAALNAHQILPVEHATLEILFLTGAGVNVIAILAHITQRLKTATSVEKDYSGTATLASHAALKIATDAKRKAFARSAIRISRVGKANAHVRAFSTLRLRRV